MLYSRLSLYINDCPFCAKTKKMFFNFFIVIKLLGCLYLIMLRVQCSAFIHYDWNFHSMQSPNSHYVFAIHFFCDADCLWKNSNNTCFTISAPNSGSSNRAVGITVSPRVYIIHQYSHATVAIARENDFYIYNTNELSVTFTNM